MTIKLDKKDIDAILVVCVEALSIAKVKSTNTYVVRSGLSEDYRSSLPYDTSDLDMWLCTIVPKPTGSNPSWTIHWNKIVEKKDVLYMNAHLFGIQD